MSFKFDLEQLVWFIKDNRVHSAPILSRMVVENKFFDKDVATQEQANAFQQFGVEREVYATIHGSYGAVDLFPSREELVNFLLGEK